jgi:hypothetical protein
MRTFELDISYPVYRDMLGGGFVDMKAGYVPFKSRDERTAARRVSRLVSKFHRVIDGEHYRAKPVALRERIEYVVPLKTY